MSAPAPGLLERLGDARALDALDEAWSCAAPSARLDRIRALAPRIKSRLEDSGSVLALTTLDVSTFPYPTRFAFGGACRLPAPFVWMHNRALLVEYRSFDGRTRRLLINPSRPEGSRKAPYFERLMAPIPGGLQPFAEQLLAERAPPLSNQLLALGIRPESIDYITFDHLHVQELGPLLGSNGQYPRARLLVTEHELNAARAPHPLQKTWYVPGAMNGVEDASVECFGCDLMLGEGVALLRTPGHTEGNHTIALNLPSGLITISENGVAAECYEPLKSKIPGLSSHAKRTGEEVILNANTLERSHDQYTSMVLEKLLSAGRSSPFVRHFPSSELVPSPLAPGLRPTFSWSRFEHGRFDRSAESG